jgi:hypothetical protein
LRSETSAANSVARPPEIRIQPRCALDGEIGNIGGSGSNSQQHQPANCLTAVPGHAFGQYDDGKYDDLASRLMLELSLRMSGNKSPKFVPSMLATRIAVQ